MCEENVAWGKLLLLLLVPVPEAVFLGMERQVSS